MHPDDDPPRRTDMRTKIVAIVLVLAMLATVAPFLAALIF